MQLLQLCHPCSVEQLWVLCSPSPGCVHAAMCGATQGGAEMPTPQHHHRCVSVCAQVNGVNVVKVGHKQVVSLIRQGGNHLVMKVVSVSRKPESEEVVRKKGRCGGIVLG